MRLEFTRATRRDALDRSRVDGKPRCEAVGADYGLPPGQRCYVPLNSGFEVHHVKEAEYGGDNNLDNALCICRTCHKHVTGKFIKGLRKADRVRDKAAGTFKRSGRGFRKPPGTRFDWKRGGYVRASGDDDSAEAILKAPR